MEIQQLGGIHQMVPHFKDFSTFMLYEALHYRQGQFASL
jgi:hypothetical protein